MIHPLSTFCANAPSVPGEPKAAIQYLYLSRVVVAS